MTEVLTRPPAQDDDVFEASAYDLPVPRMDGHKATVLEIGFAGSGTLDRTSEDDLDLLRRHGLARRSVSSSSAR